MKAATFLTLRPGCGLRSNSSVPIAQGMVNTCPQDLPTIFIYNLAVSMDVQLLAT